VKISAEAMERIRSARQNFAALMDQPGVTIYGVTSGYGQNAKKRLTPEERRRHARTPPVAATASWGEFLPERVSRAIVFARLANFIEGHAAVSPHIAEAVAALLKSGRLAPVPARGQGGAGEIMSLSHLFHELAETNEPGEKDVLSLINGSPAASGLAADACLAAIRRIELAAKVMAHAARAFRTPDEHFGVQLDSFWNNPHDAWALQKLRKIMGSSGALRRPYQAPVSFRIMPRILGQARRAALLLEEVAGESLAAVTDNPVIVPPDAGMTFGKAMSTGGYHNPHVPMALDSMTAAYANLGLIAERMASKLLDGSVSLLAPQLGAEAGLSYLGCLPMAMVGYQEEMRLLAQPSLLPGSESGGFGQNDVASPVFPAWSKQERAGELLEQTLASLAVISTRAFQITGDVVPENLREVSADVRETVPDLDRERPIGGQIAALARIWRERLYAS
jgi:histidine ammonia-lyase